MIQQLIRSRIAPTPSGYLHRGNAYNFLLTSLLTTGKNGRLRLRIDDLDAPRVREDYLKNIFETLHWLNIQWDDGPRDLQDYKTRFIRQSETDLLNKIKATGQVFACTCSRKETAVQSTDGQYAGTCIGKMLPLDTKDACWRIKTPPGTSVTFKDEIRGVQHMDLYDTARHFIVRRRDMIPAYPLASLSDDIRFGINMIVRGEDLLPGTAAQLYLAGLIEDTIFPATAFYHHPLLTDSSGHKLSKSGGSTSLKALLKDAETSRLFITDFRDWLNNNGMAYLADK